MKKLFLIALLCVFNFANIEAQAPDLRRKIEVFGIAEQEITPDILHISISLKEYMDGRNKITITQLENQLEQAITEAGIPKTDFTVNNISSWNYAILKKRNPDFLASKQYGLTVHDLNKFNKIISKIDAKGIQSTYIESYDYSKMDQLRNELKLKALVNAKQKASLMLMGIDQKLGDPILITEVDNGNNFPTPRNVSFMAKNMSADAVAQTDSDIDFKKIKLNFEVRAVFEILK